MIPIGDSPRTRHFPLLNWVLIIANVLVFVVELGLGPGELEAFISRWAAVPRDVNELLARPWSANPQVLLTLVSSQFLHGGWLHLISNMLFLWIFGDNIEDVLGTLRYLVLYLASGVAAVLVQSLASGNSTIPLLGASGAIAGVLGAYMILFPGARVSTLVPIFLFFTVIELPAVVLILVWFALQLLSAWAGLQGAAQSGVAWWAHVGGFVAGLVFLFLLGGGRGARVSRRQARYYYP